MHHKTWAIKCYKFKCICSRAFLQTWRLDDIWLFLLSQKLTFLNISDRKTIRYMYYIPSPNKHDTVDTLLGINVLCWSVVAERSSALDSSSGDARMWVRIPALSKTLNHNCFVLRMGHKAVGPMCCVKMYILCNFYLHTYGLNIWHNE